MPDLLNLKTIVTAFVGAMFAQFLILFITLVKNKRHLALKKELLIEDLKNQREVLNRLKIALIELRTKFEEKDALKHTYDAFKDLHTEVYDSIPKTDLFKIFLKQIHQIIKIYKQIEFLIEHSIDSIYTNYKNRMQNHLNEKKDNPDHKFYCETHIGYLQNSIDQTNNNINTIEDTIRDINKIISHLND